MKPLFSSIILLLGLSCSVKQGEVSADRNSRNSENNTNANNTGETTQPPKDDDALAIPVNISGGHLTCAVRKEATESSLESEIGCRLTEAGTDTKVAPDAKLSFSNSRPDVVSSELQAAASIYHVLYRIKGESKDAIVQTTQTLDALVLYSEKTIKTEKVIKVLKPAIQLNDYEAPIVRDQAIDTDDGGSL